VSDAPIPTFKVGALFVDFESIYYALVNHPVCRFSRESAMSVAVDALNALRNRLREDRYALIVERSYADWERISLSAQRQLQIYGLMPRFVDSRTDKNTADIELSLDILQYMLTRPELQHIVLVGGDRDYLPILRRIKEQYRSIRICSLKSTLSGDVREFAQNYTQAKVLELDGLIDWPQPYERSDDANAHFFDYHRSVIVSSASQSSTAGSTAPGDSGPVGSINVNGGSASASGANTSINIERPPSTGLLRRPITNPAIKRSVQVNEWHERYLHAMVKFMNDNTYQEIHLGPFFRWLRGSQLFDLVSTSELKRVFDELVEIKAVTVEERDTGQGYSFSVAHLNWSHELSQKIHAVINAAAIAAAAAAGTLAGDPLPNTATSDATSAAEGQDALKVEDDIAAAISGDLTPDP
jgi:uncharacterized LabA/DUF88 family protein